MTRERAAELLSEVTVLDDPEMAEAHRVAISALRQQEHFRDLTKKVEPLTLDDLRQMDKASEPVYLYIFRSDIDSGWQIIEQITDRKIIFRGSMGIYVPIKELGVSYNLYRRKPEEDDHE